MDSRPCTSKWQDDYSSRSGFSNFLGCFEDQVGRSSLRIQNRMSLERARSPRPYKLFGAGSSISGSQSFFASYKREACPVWPGQPHCSSAHQMAGRYKILVPHSISTRHMVLRTGQEHGDISNSCAGKWNRIADGKSRIFHDSIEWALDHNLFKQITKHIGLPVVDLFASRINHQMPEFVSWRPEPGAIATDAFNIPWDFPLSYRFPPFFLIPMCLRKVIQEQVDCIHIAPVWRSQPWYPAGSENPEPSKDRQDSSPLLPKKKFQLAAWKISGKAYKTKAFKKKCQKFFILLEKQHSQAIRKCLERQE